MMLVKEEGGGLWLAAGAPKAWLDTRDGFAVTNAPTDYGTLTYRVLPEPAAKLVRAVVDPVQSGVRRPAEVHLRLAAGFGTLNSATLNGKPVAIRGDSVVFSGSALSNRIEVTASYR